MKIPYVNCGWRKEYGSDARSYQHTKLVVKEKPEKNSGPYGIWTLDFCYTGAVLYQMNWQANWELENFWQKLHRHSSQLSFIAIRGLTFR